MDIPSGGDGLNLNKKIQLMKTNLKNLFLLPALIAGLGLIPAGRVGAQTFTTLYSFTAFGFLSITNSDGRGPLAGLILSGNTLYGTAEVGGSFANGTVFKVNTTGTGFTTLSSFTGDGNDGVGPDGGLILSGNTLYGTASQGGSANNGTVFAVNTDGSSFTNLHSFTALNDSTNSDGATPVADLVLSGNTLYGTAQVGGSFGNGTVFAISTNGTGFTNLHSFTATSGLLSTNGDGANPYAGLILTGNTLYGTAETGGGFGNGTVFKLNTNGTGFTNLHSFTALINSTNSDGAYPDGGLVLSNNTLYGTAYLGGSSGKGTVFAVNTNGTGFTNLHSFTATSGPFPSTNSDGANPSAGLILSSNTLYGTAQFGGSSGKGTVFAVNPDGAGFTNLHSFTATVSGTNSDGANPQCSLILSGSTFYGTTPKGGSSGGGTVFSLLLEPVSAPQLTINRSGAIVILTWPVEAVGFALQSAPAVTGIFTNILPAATSPFTNSITGTQQFYRLSQ